MYCSSCGQANVPGASACSRCGHPLYASPAEPYPSGVVANARIEKHLQPLAILWIVLGAFGLMGWFIAIPFFAVLFGVAHQGIPMYHGWPMPFGGLHWLFPFITVLVFARSGLQILTGVALLMRVQWGRVLAIVIAVLSLFKIPFGTALGIYTLWVLLPADSAVAYGRVSVTR